MPRPKPTYLPVPVRPTGEELCADGVMTVAQAARYCGVRTKTMREILSRREVPSFLLGARRVVPRRALVRWLGRRLEEGCDDLG